MKKIVGIIVIILMIPFVIYVIGDIDRTPIYPITEFNIIDKPSDKQLLSNDKLLYQLPNTIDITINELPLFVEYYENGTLEIDSGILNYTINDDLAYINFIEAEFTQVVDGELIFSKPTQIISKSSNLFDGELEKGRISSTTGQNIGGTGYRTITPIKMISGISYIWATTVDRINVITIYDNDMNFISQETLSFSISDNKYISSYTATIDGYFRLHRGSMNEYTDNDILAIKNSMQVNEGTTLLPYEPFAEHIYDLGDGIELYKLPNGVSDKWYQDGTLEKNIGVIDTVNNYVEYGTLPQGTYDNILEFINNNQNKQIKIFFDDNIQESRYNTYLENDTIIINNDTEVIRIYNNDTYTSTRNLDIDITYKLEGYNIIGYIDGEFDNTVLAFFWIIPVLLVGGLIFLLIGKRKE